MKIDYIKKQINGQLAVYLHIQVELFHHTVGNMQFIV